MGHSPLGASKAHCWLPCPGSVEFCKDIPSRSSAYADEGTDAHALGEHCLATRTATKNYIGEEFTHDKGTFIVTEEMAEFVQVYVDAVMSCFKAAGPAAQLYIEHKFDLSAYAQPEMFGTCDALVILPGEAMWPFDLKYGAGTWVDVADNPQLRYYALGALQLVKGNVKKIYPTIVQPRMDAPHVRSEELTKDELLTWAETVLLPGAVATRQPNAPLCAGEKQCKFCAGKPTCPERLRHATEIAKEAFMVPAKTLPQAAALTPQQLRSILDKSKMVEDWFKAIREHVFEEVKAGRMAPADVGYKLVAGRASRSWADEKCAEALLQMLLGEKAYTKKLLTPAAAEKVVKDKEAISRFVVSTRGEQLAPITDNRQALTASTDGFTPYEGGAK